LGAFMEILLFASLLFLVYLAFVGLLHIFSNL
jgi:hypothetical protein